MDFSTGPNHELLKTELQKLIQHQKSEFKRIAELTGIKQKAVHDYFLIEQVSEVHLKNKRTHEATVSSLAIEENESIFEQKKKEAEEFEECAEELYDISKRYFTKNNIHMFSVLSRRKGDGNSDRHMLHKEVCTTLIASNFLESLNRQMGLAHSFRDYVLVNDIETAYDDTIVTPRRTKRRGLFDNLRSLPRSEVERAEKRRGYGNLVRDKLLSAASPQQQKKIRTRGVPWTSLNKHKYYGDVKNRIYLHGWPVDLPVRSDPHYSRNYPECELMRLMNAINAGLITFEKVPKTNSPDGASSVKEVSEKQRNLTDTVIKDVTLTPIFYKKEQNCL